MSDNIQKLSKRDTALVNILERMVDQIHLQDKMLHELIDRQVKITGSIDDSMFHQNLQHDEVDAAFKKLHDSFTRYRSDMLGFVREQDTTRKGVENTLKQVNELGYSFEGTGKIVSDIDARLKKHEKAVHDHIAFSSQKWESLPIATAETNRNIADLHVYVEKSFKQIREETKQHLEKHQKETVRRLHTLDNIMTALETLLIRTEPPEKRPLWILRVFRSIGRFFRWIVVGFFRCIGRFFAKTLPRMLSKLCFWKKKPPRQ